MDGFEWRGTPCPISEHAEAHPVVSDLAGHRWRGRILSEGEERDLIRQSQAGDAGATRTLLEKFGRQALRIAGRYYGPPFEERLAVGYAALFKAIGDFDLGRGYRLGTVVGKYVGLAVWTFVRSYSRRWPAHVSLSSFREEAPERNDRDGERWETWEPQRVGYRKPFGRVNWWYRPPSWIRYSKRVVVTPMRVLEPAQRLLKQIGTLYRLGSNAPWRGPFKPWSGDALNGGVEYATQSRQAGNGPVRIVRPSRAVRIAELQRDMAAFNAGHNSYMNNAGLGRLLRGQKSLNIPKPDPIAALECEVTRRYQDGRVVVPSVRRDLSQSVVRTDRRTAPPRQRNVGRRRRASDHATLMR